MLALIASPLRVLVATAFFVSITLLIYAPIIIPLVFFIDWLYASGYIPWDQWRILYTVFFLYVSFILLHVIADNLFGLTYREIIQDNNSEEATANNSELAWLYQAFEEVKKQFPSEKKAQVFFTATSDINALAFRDLRHKGVIIYGGLVQAIVNKNTGSEVVAAIKGILAHELSHLTNWDFFSGQYTQALHKQYLLHMKIRNNVYLTLWEFLPVILIIGLFARWAMAILYNFSNVFIRALTAIYIWLDAAISRSIEFRCDRQAAKAAGWQSIFLGLNSLPIQSRSNLFDSHPDIVSRLLYVHRRGGRQSSQQHISGSILARITALMLFPILFLLAWWLGEVAQVLPQGHFSPFYQSIILYFHSIPGFNLAVDWFNYAWDLIVSNLIFVFTWGQQESTQLWPWIQTKSLEVWSSALGFHGHLLVTIENLYHTFFQYTNKVTGWNLKLSDFIFKWLSLISTLFAELLFIRLFLASLSLTHEIFAWLRESLFLVRFALATRIFRKKAAPELDNLLVTALNQNNYSAILRLIRKGAHPARVTLTTGLTLVQHLRKDNNPLANSIARLLPKE